MNNVIKKLAAQKATLYFLGGMGYTKVEARSWATDVAPYAQHAAAVFFAFIGKGQRNPRGAVQTFQPSLVVLEGCGDIRTPRRSSASPRPRETSRFAAVGTWDARPSGRTSSTP